MAYNQRQQYYPPQNNNFGAHQEQWQQGQNGAEYYGYNDQHYTQGQDGYGQYDGYGAHGAHGAHPAQGGHGGHEHYAGYENQGWDNQGQYDYGYDNQVNGGYDQYYDQQQQQQHQYDQGYPNGGNYDNHGYPPQPPQPQQQQQQQQHHQPPPAQGQPPPRDRRRPDQGEPRGKPRRDRILQEPVSPVQMGWDNPFPTFPQKKKEAQKKEAHKKSSSLDKAMGQMSMNDARVQERPATSHGNRRPEEPRPNTSHGERDQGKRRSGGSRPPPPTGGLPSTPYAGMPPPPNGPMSPPSSGGRPPGQNGATPQGRPRLNTAQSQTDPRGNQYPQPGQPFSPTGPEGPPNGFQQGRARALSRSNTTPDFGSTQPPANWQDLENPGGYQPSRNPPDVRPSTAGGRRQDRPDMGRPGAEQPYPNQQPPFMPPNQQNQPSKPSNGPEMPNFAAIQSNGPEDSLLPAASGATSPPPAKSYQAYQKPTYTPSQPAQVMPKSVSQPNVQKNDPSLGEFSFDLPGKSAMVGAAVGAAGMAAAAMAPTPGASTMGALAMGVSAAVPTTRGPGVTSPVDSNPGRKFSASGTRGNGRDPRGNVQSPTNGPQYPVPGQGDPRQNFNAQEAQAQYPPRTASRAASRTGNRPVRQNTLPSQQPYGNQYDQPYDQQDPNGYNQPYGGYGDPNAAAPPPQDPYNYAQGMPGGQPPRPQQGLPNGRGGPYNGGPGYDVPGGRPMDGPSIPAQPGQIPPPGISSRPAPVRPGLNPQPDQARPLDKPAPVRQYDQPVQAQQAPPPQETPAQPAKRTSMPVNAYDLNLLQNAIRSNPEDHKTALTYAKKLVEAASVLASEGGKADAKTTQKNREKYIFDAHKQIKRLVNANYPEAMFYLADCYGVGRLGLQVDAREAFNLYQSAAKLGHAPSAYRVAVCCEMGNEEGGGTKRDPARAATWFKRAASLGDVPAMYKTAMIMLKGLLGQPQNRREAYTWLKRAAERADAENPHALHELGLLYESAGPNDAVIRDPKHARELFEQAAKLGYKFSQFRLGTAWEYGLLDCPIDARNSIMWYSKAASLGEHQSELALSGWYLTGSDGILQQSDTEAYLWARKAAQSGLAKAEYAMGYFTEVGIGVPANLDEAKKWYWRAAAQNYPKARERLESLKKGGGKMQKTRVSRSNLNKQTDGECSVM